MLEEDKKTVANNTLMLYLLSGSNYIFGFITVPLLTRVLGAKNYGLVGFASSTAYIVQMILEFGFILSATIEVANNRDNRAEICKIVTCVTYAKVLLILAVIPVLVILCLTVDSFRSEPILFSFYFMYAAISALLPDFFFRGIERMTVVTIRTVIIKAVFTSCVFIFIHGPSQYILVPIFYLLGGILATVFAYYQMKINEGVWFVSVSFKDVFLEMRNSFLFFLSRIASTAYSSLNTVVLGILYAGLPVVGFYTSCDKLILAGRNAITPLSNSLFPYVVRTKNLKIVYQVSIIGTSILIGICLFIAVNAEAICIMLFGDGYADAAPILRIMLPLIPISLPSYLFGWSALGALNKSNIANTSVFVGAGVQLSILLFAFTFGLLSPELICWSTMLAELVVLTIRIIATFITVRKNTIKNHS